MLRRIALAVAVGALVFAATASAKLTNVTVSTPVAAPRPHVPWTVTVHVSLRGKPYTKPGYKPTLYLVTKGTQVATFHGVAIAPGVFRVRIVFPRPGTWRYVIPDPLNGDWTFAAPRVAT